MRISRSKLTIDIVLAGVFGLACLPFALLGNWVDVVALCLFASALAVRRGLPAWSLALAWIGALVQMLMLRDLQLYDAAVLGVLYSSAAHGGRVVRWVGLASAGAGAVLATGYLAVVKPLIDNAGFADPSNVISTVVVTGVLFVASIAVLVLSWTAGLLVRSVRDTREVSRREDAANRERGLVEYRYVVEQERNRIARDMHDVVAHSLAVVIAQADGGRFAAPTRPDAAVEALDTIAGVARGALGDVRLLLAELRHDEAGAPQPVIDDLTGLLERVRSAGLDVRFSEAGQRLPLGTGHQIAVYRIVQEALTNALRHGDVTAPVQLELVWDAGGVTVEIVNSRRADAPTPETHAFRHGIPGMRERAQLAGGTLQVEAGADGMFRVTARIPAQTGSPA
ncbi:sensor histidine kinase [Agromyces laixinhei]|uniref:sensor histidine kinase n=1 Tax=Agromyces laixinhei TaxID=2585717 RepID=UPI0018DE69B2|nr:histidine kinase [Agromyces laixinhei]